MMRHVLIAALLCLTGCLFGGDDLPVNAKPNNDNVTPNNANNTISNNVEPNIAPNLEPNVVPNGEPCPIDTTPACELTITCSPDATPDCPGCGQCEDGVCAAGPNGAIGLCIDMAPIPAAEIGAAGESGGMGESVAVADRIYIGQPNAGAGRVIVASLDGDFEREIRAPDASSRFGFDIDAIDGAVAIGCPGCGADGQVFFESANQNLEAVYLTADGDPRERVGDDVAVMSTRDQTWVIAGAPDTVPQASAMLFRRQNGWILDERASVDTVLFGLSVAADDNSLVIGSATPTVQARTAIAASWAIADFDTSTARTDIVALSEQNQLLVAGGDRELELFERRNMNWQSLGVQAAGSGVWQAAAIGEQVVYVGTTTGEVRVFRVIAGDAVQLGTLDIPGLTDLDAHDGIIVAGAANATGADAVYAWRISIR